MSNNFYESYVFSRDKSWQITIDFNINKLPVDVFELCRKMGILIYPYSKSFNLIKARKLLDCAKNNEGFSTIINESYVVFYDDNVKYLPQISFTICHELGHIVDGDLLTDNQACQNSVTVWNKSDLREPNELEMKANIFASRILAPACVLWGLNIHTAEDIRKLCGLSLTSAKIREERMNVLYKRNKFLTSSLERQVFDQFKDFIEEYKMRNK